MGRQLAFSHFVIPTVCASPRKDGLVESFELRRGRVFPLVFGVVVVENRDGTAVFGGLLHIVDRQTRIGDPLQGPRGDDDVKLPAKPLRRCISVLELQAVDSGVFLSRDLDKRHVSINADHAVLGAHGPCNACGNGSGPAADVEEKHSRARKFSEAAVVPFESSPAKDARVGSVELGRHVPFNMEHASHRGPQRSRRPGGKLAGL
jgi:hypothetical protein